MKGVIYASIYVKGCVLVMSNSGVRSGFYKEDSCKYVVFAS